MKKFIALSMLLSLAACDWFSASVGKLTKLGGDMKVSCYSGGKKVLSDITKGQPQNEQQTDGYYWVSRVDNKYREASMDCVFEEN